MMFFKSALTLSALLVLASAMTLERNGPAHEEMSILVKTDAKASSFRAPSFSISTSDCEKEDEDDCKEFCGLSEQTATCSANGNKVTCSCKGGKSGTNCEERCFLFVEEVIIHRRSYVPTPLFSSGSSLALFHQALVRLRNAKSILLQLLLQPHRQRLRLVLPPSATTTITSQHDASALQNCVVIDGSILLSPSAQGPIIMDGPQNITGNVVVVNTGLLTGFTSSSISTISGNWTLSNLSSLYVIDLPNLSAVGNLAWTTLPGMCWGTAGPITTNSMTISDTSSRNLIDITNATGSLNISNNPNVADFPFNTTPICGSLNIHSNGVAKFSFPNLIWANNITATVVTKLSFPNLATVNGPLSIYEYGDTSINVPQLSTIGNYLNGVVLGSLTIMSNPQLTSLGLNSLQAIKGNLSITGNGALRSMALTPLEFVGANVVLEGDISTLVLLL
ncbi:hypothetical protein G7Y89_g9534 [Cudoniella acicularis]|uniref:EGF-like domain-containing protein n=1 Tax=Cudoniella acicularis TaxID=354080 RepID=A0A8H4RGR8_9HELO|nr:hypothetical protein G7Y89_g9534 [Cudoniella acicularis]